MAQQAENEGVEVLTNCAASEVLSNSYGGVLGVLTRDMGIAKDGSQKDSFMPGAQVNARVTMFAEGCRGSLSEVRLYTRATMAPANIRRRQQCHPWGGAS